MVQFGVITATSYFMNIMNDVFSSELDDCIFVFLHNILLHSHIMEDYDNHLKKVMEPLCQHCLFSKISNWNIMVKEDEHLGQWIMPQGIVPTKER